MLEVGARTGDAKPPFRGPTPVLVASSQTTNPVCLALYCELRKKGGVLGGLGLGLDNGKQKAFSTLKPCISSGNTKEIMNMRTNSLCMHKYY